MKSPSLLLIFSALLSLALVYSTSVTTQFSVDGNSADWDTAKVPAAFQKGTSYNKVNMQSTGLHTYSCPDQITFCTTGSWRGSLRTHSPFINTVSVVGSLTLPRGGASSSLGECNARRGKATKSHIFTAVVNVAGNLRVTAVVASPNPYTNGISVLENFPEGSPLSLTFSRTFPATNRWKSLPSAITTGLPSCDAALPNAGHRCPTGLFYYKSYGIVFLSGLFLPADPTSVVRTSNVFATLPEEARPQYDNDYVVICDTIKIGYVTVKTTGEITFSGRASKWCSLDGISYLFAQDISGGSASPFNLKFGSLFRSPTSDSRSPVVAVTKDLGVQFLTPFQNGIGSTLASFNAPVLCDSDVEVKFPVVIDSVLAFAKSTVSQGTFTFTLEPSALSPVPGDFRRAFVADNSSTGYFALLLQGYGTPATISFTFADAGDAPIAAALYTPPTQFTVSSGAAAFTETSSASGENSLFELSFTETSLVQAGNKVTVTVNDVDTFPYYFS